MSTTQTKSNGTNYSVSIPPPEGSKDWSNYGNLYLVGDGRHGTFYLNVTVAQLDALKATADADGHVKAKIGVFRSKPKAASAS